MTSPRARSVLFGLPIFAAFVACVGDEPAGNGGAGSSSSSGDSPAGGSSSSGAVTASSSGGEVSSSSSGDAAIEPDAGPPQGAVLWGTSFDQSASVTGVVSVADSVAGTKILARSVDLVGSAFSKTVRVDWYRPDSTVIRSKTFTSASPIEPSGVRLDAAGNAYLSLNFTDAITSAGESNVAPSPTDGTVPTGTKCAVIRLGALDGSISWARTFYAVGTSFPTLSNAGCRVSRVRSEGTALDYRVLVSGVFTGPGLHSNPGTGVIAAARYPLRGAPSATDGFVAVLDASSGDRRALESLGADGNSVVSYSVAVDDAAFLGSSKLLVAGRSSSYTVTRGNSAQVLAQWPSRGPNETSPAAVVFTLDLQDPAASSGEAWYAVPTTTPDGAYTRSSEATAIVGREDQLAVVVSAKASHASSLVVPGLPDTPLGTAGRHLVVGIGPESSRRVFAVEKPASGGQALMQTADGRVVLATSTGGAIDYGPSCRAAGASGLGTTLAFFTDATLRTCTRSVSYPNAVPHRLSGSQDVAVLTGHTTGAVVFDTVTIPAAAGPQGYAIEIAP